MKDKTIRNIRLCLFAALVLCAAWILLMSMHFFQLLSDSENINWLVNGFWKAILMVMYIGSAAVTMFLCIKIVLNTFRGLRENTVFPKNNVGLLFWLALAFFIHLLCRTNEPILFDDVAFRLISDVFLIPFFVIFFAFMYKVAADAVEENNLTV